MVAEVYVCPPDHKHGKNATCYGGHGCRCSQCRESHRVRCDRRRREIAYGRWSGLIDAAPAREHVNAMRGSGWTVRDIALTAGLSEHVVTRVSRNDGQTILGSTAAALLAVSDSRADLLPGRLVDATGTVRRLRALVFMGWTVKELMRRIGSNPSYGHRIMSSAQVFERTRARVIGLYEELWDQVPLETTGEERFLARRARRHARTHGWVGPLAWDDDTIDDAAATPPEAAEPLGLDEIAIELSIRGDQPRLTQAERRVVVERLHARRWSDGRIADHVGVVVEKTIVRDREALSLRAWRQDEMTEERGAA